MIGEPVFAIAGHLWRDHEGYARAGGLGLLAAAFVAEGAYQAAVDDHGAAGTGFIVVGTLLPLLLGRTRAGRIAAYAATVPALGPGALGFPALLWPDGAAAGLS